MTARRRFNDIHATDDTRNGIDNAEVRRRVRAIDGDHRSALAMFRDALDRAFDPGSGTDAGTKSQLLGLPDRRGFLKIGGLTVATSAILVACSSDTTTTSTNPSTTKAGSTGTTAGTAPMASNAAAITDATLVLTAESIEQLAIATYQAAIDSGLVKNEGVATAAQYFQAQHRDHAGLLASTATAMGQTATGKPNPYLDENVVQPALKGLTDEKGVVLLALALEQAAAETYTYAGGVLSVPPLRQAIMTIGGIEARHMSVLNHVLGESPVIVKGFMPTADAAPKESFIAPVGDVTPVPAG